MQKIKSACNNNSDVEIHGDRYDDSIKFFAASLFMIGGWMLYERLPNNLPSSSLCTVSGTISSMEDCIVGEFCSKELKYFLEHRNLPLD